MPERVSELLSSFLRKGFFGPPILVEKSSLAILDGHHRFSALKRLGAVFVPAILADYSGIPVFHYSKPGVPFPKEEVLRKAISGKKFPPKTTRHIYPRPPPVFFELSSLIGTEKRGRR